MEGMILSRSLNDNELEKLKVGSKIDVYLERINFKGGIILSQKNESLEKDGKGI